MTLSQRLLLRILPMLVITISIVGALAYRSATREIDNIYDAQLIGDANVLWALLKKPLTRHEPRPEIHVPDLDFTMDNQLALNQDADDYADAHSFRAWRGTAIAVDSSNPFPADTQPLANGFSDVPFDGSTWRIYSLHIPNTDIVIEVAEDIGLREALIWNILANVALPLLILIPVLALVTWLAIDNGLLVIRKLVRQIRTRNPDDLSRVAVEGTARDLVPLVHALNGLLQKVEDSITMERRFADLAAHQLRTPQAGIKLLLQLFAGAETEAERQRLLTDLTASNDRAMHLIEQLLKLARVGNQPLRLETVELDALAAKALADFGPLLVERGFDIELKKSDADARVRADQSLLRVMIDNIVDNAIKYTPAGGRITVEIEPCERGWRLSVSDSGPGISAEQRAAAFQRFNRLQKNDGAGAGLGLAIVADIAGRLAIDVSLDTPEWGTGLKVRLDIRAA